MPWLPVAIVSLWLVCPAPAQDLSPIGFLPGDTQIGLAVETQDWPSIAAGGPGYLVVWDDKRPVLSTVGNTPTGVAFQGNGFDIYGALLDTQGQVIKSPIVIANQGRNQVRPQVAWNGESFLVVWTSQRPDWYFFQDIMAIRVSADGELLDPEPFVLRPNHNVPFQPNDYAENPRITSDGTNWVVVWEGMIWVETQFGFSAHPNIAGIRVAPDGTILDPEPVVIYQQNSVAFGPTLPDIACAGDEFLVVWDDSGIVSRRVDLNLQPLGPTTTIHQFSSRPRVASDGTDFLVVDYQNRGFRVTHEGSILDPAGINFDAGGQMSQPGGPDVDWDGAMYTIAFGSGENSSADANLYTARIGTDGTLIGPTLTLATSDFEWKAAVAGGGQGEAQIAFTTRDNLIPEDVKTVQLAADGTIGTTVDTGVGLHRQAYLRFASNGAEHMALYVSDGEGQRRILVQRVNSCGVAIDSEPTLLTTFSEIRDIEPDIAFNGTHFLVVWADFFGEIVGQRIATDGTLVDPNPVVLIGNAGGTGHIAVGALDDMFLVVYSITQSFDQQYFRAVRVQGSDLAVLDQPFFVAFDFANDPRVTGFGDRWLLVWEDQTNHDQSTSVVRGKFIEANGTVGASLSIQQNGWADDPDIAVAGDRALIAWWDTTSLANTTLKGRIMLSNGTFATGEFQIADANNDQRQPAVGWDGEKFVVAWMDFREVNGVEHERADIYAARVGLDGSVTDPGGFALTNTALPEELPDVAGFGGTTMIGFSMLHGEFEPEIQRIGYRILNADMILLGDVNCDGVVNLLDVQPFIDVLSSGVYLDRADINQDGVVNLLDVQGFIQILGGSG